MQNKQPEAPPPMIRIEDVYFLLFRNKWTIFICTLLGAATAAVLFFQMKPKYRSEARLLVRYITDSAPMNLVNKENSVKSPDYAGASIISSEVQILTSLDLADKVVEELTPAKVLSRVGGSTNRARAVAIISDPKNLLVDVPPRSSVISVSYEHPDPDMAQSVLQTLIDKYLVRHQEIHRSTAANEEIEAQATAIHARLQETEAKLLRERNKFGIISLEDSKDQVLNDLTAIKRELAQAESSIAQFEAAFKEKEKLFPSQTNAASGVSTQIVATADVTDYRAVCDLIERARSTELDLLTRFTEENPAVKAIRLQLGEARKKKAAMEELNPGLRSVGATVSQMPDPKTEFFGDRAQMAALRSKTNFLYLQLVKVLNVASNLDSAESTITELQRERKLQQAQYELYASSVEKNKLEQRLDTTKLANINIIQAASNPSMNLRPARKAIQIALIAGLLAGLGLALLREFVLDQTVKRASDLERGRIPLMLAIPENEQNTNGTPSATTAYCEALRDRLIVELEALKKRPKLVGVTTCGKGAGASTIAVGLAAALSETGEGSVLLLDLNLEQGSAHQFFRGKPLLSLGEVLEKEKRDSALVQDNLYLASLRDSNGMAKHSVPTKRIADLVPRLRAADYDYIIFDMPPVSHTGITYRLSSYLDKTLMVVEAEKTQRNVLHEAYQLLQQSGSKVTAVLNKQRTYVPNRLHQQLDGNRSS